MLRLGRVLLTTAGWFAIIAPMARSNEFSAVDYQRQTIYHSPQTLGFTSWVGAWTMPDDSLMVSFTQATGPVEGRPQIPNDIQHRLTWPPADRPAGWRNAGCCWQPREEFSAVVEPALLVSSDQGRT